MKLNLKTFFLTCLIIGFCYSSLIIKRFVTKFNPNESILTGKVIDYINVEKIAYPEDRPKSIGNNFWGILIEVTENIYIPGIESNFYEIYPFKVSYGLKLISYRKSELKQNFPIGSTLRVVATPPEILIGVQSKYPILEVSPKNNFTMSINIDTVSVLNSTKLSEYEYPQISGKERLKFANQLADSLNINKLNRANFGFSIIAQWDFELRKDLWRLHFIDNDTLKIPIIKRIMKFNDFGEKYLKKLLNDNIENPEIRREILNLKKY